MRAKFPALLGCSEDASLAVLSELKVAPRPPHRPQAIAGAPVRPPNALWDGAPLRSGTGPLFKPMSAG